MNEFELPQLPAPGEVMSKWAYDESDMQAYATAAIEADRKRRGEPKDRRDIRGIVKKLQSAYVKDGSTDEWIRLRRHVLEEAIDTLRLVSADCAHFYESYKAACERATQPAEPVKVPSAHEINQLWTEVRYQDARTQTGHILAFALALLSKYAAPQPPQTPEGYKLVPIEPADAMLKAAQTAWLNDPARRTTTVYRAMLEAAPEVKG